MKTQGHRKLNGTEKAAALLLTLDAEASARLLATLPDDSIAAVGKAMADLDLEELDPEKVAEIHEEFLEGVREGASIPPGLSDLLTKTLGPERGRQILARVEENVKQERPFVALERLEDARILRVLRGEHPQVVALVCSRIPAERAAAVLGALSDEERIDVIVRMANMKPIERAMVDSVATALGVKADALGSMPVDDPNRRLRSVAEVLNAAEPEIEREILESLEAKDADLTREIKERMFTFEDLARLDKRGMQRVLASVEVRQLALALKAADPEIAENFFANMTKRVKETVQEELELLGPVPVADVLKAQNEMMLGIRALVEKGEIRPTRGGSLV